MNHQYDYPILILHQVLKVTFNWIAINQHNPIDSWIIPCLHDTELKLSICKINLLLYYIITNLTFVGWFTAGSGPFLMEILPIVIAAGLRFGNCSRCWICWQKMVGWILDFNCPLRHPQEENEWYGSWLRYWTNKLLTTTCATKLLYYFHTKVTIK